MSEELWVRADAPFAAYRWLQAGVYRASSPVMTPTAAWGLLLGIAAIETRGDLNELVTPIRDDSPPLQIAIGIQGPPETARIYQQLHSYPVGSEGAERRKKTHGAKYHIAPATREVLVDLRCVLGVRGEVSLLERIVDGLEGRLQGQRYGLPFAGDNNFFFAALDRLDGPLDAEWYVPMAGASGPMPRSVRLTTAIDRKDAAGTTSRPFAPSPTLSRPPEEAWCWVPREP